jgi:serine/threonine protein kinase
LSRLYDKVRNKEENATSPITAFDRTSNFDELSKSDFMVVRKLASGINGDVFEYAWCCGGMTRAVSVKKLRQRSLQIARSKVANERSLHMKRGFLEAPEVEDALTEIGVLSYLSRQPDLPKYLLRMHGVFSDDEFTCLVTEFADGGELFAVVAFGHALSEGSIQTYARQLLQGVEYLHRHNIGHRDVSLENVLLKNGETRLMDFGAAVCSHSPSGIPLRYFFPAGKDFYRSPEMHVPTIDHVKVTAPSDSIPNGVKTLQATPWHDKFWCDVRFPEDVVPGQTCIAEVCGYIVPPADVFAVGVCLFMCAFQCGPWRRARFQDAHFAFVFNRADWGLESLLKVLGKQPPSNEIMPVLSAMLHPDPSQRPSASSCLEKPWLSYRAYSSAPVLELV